MRDCQWLRINATLCMCVLQGVDQKFSAQPQSQNPYFNITKHQNLIRKEFKKKASETMCEVF